MGTAEDVKWHKITSRKMLPTLTKDAKRVLRCLQKIIASACAWQLHRTSLFLYLYNKNHNYTLFMLENISKSSSSWDQLERDRARGRWHAEQQADKRQFSAQEKKIWIFFQEASESRKEDSFRANPYPKWICSELRMLESSLTFLNPSYHI